MRRVTAVLLSVVLVLTVGCAARTELGEQSPPPADGAGSGKAKETTATTGSESEPAQDLEIEGLGITKHPPAAGKWNRHRLAEFPTEYEMVPGKDLDLRCYDLSHIDLGGKADDLLCASFDTLTGWPEKLPSEFIPDHIMELGRNPGLNVRSLHETGITGKGIGIAVIDQALLVDHAEYKGQLRHYEEIHCSDRFAQMHGPAVASIAVGRTVGVAPDADLYYISEHGTWQGEGVFEWDLTWLAASIDRVLEINQLLPAERKIRAISISLGVGSGDQKGTDECLAAIERCKQEGIMVCTCATGVIYDVHLNGLGRDPLSDPDDPSSYQPMTWWSRFARWPYDKLTDERRILVCPMQSRCVAAPQGSEHYVFYRVGGISWTAPWMAGLYCLCCQVKPDITPEEFWELALTTGKPMEGERNGENTFFGVMVDPMALIQHLQEGND